MCGIGAGLAISLLAGLSSGCGTTTSSRFFALQPLPEASAPAGREHYGEGLLIGVGPVLTPNYLDPQRIAVVETPPEIYYSEYNQWASALEENITDVLVQNLGSLLGTCRITRFPLIQEMPGQYRVSVQISRFDGVPGGKALLDAQWRVSNASRESAPILRSALLEEPVGAKDYAGLVTAQSALLGELSRRIAADISFLEKSKPAREEKDELGKSPAPAVPR
jgi:uncharacterized lipoprotein YmbA